MRARRPRPGRYHPASAADVRSVLRAFGEEIYYGLESVELVPAPYTGERLIFGEFVAPGRILLYDQPPPPWRLVLALEPEERTQFQAAGANLGEDGVVSWPGGTLRLFMLGYVLAHELGHHTLQHERRLRRERGARTREHETRAELVAARLRRLLDCL